jgi:hypothetical protein
MATIGSTAFGYALQNGWDNAAMDITLLTGSGSATDTVGSNTKTYSAALGLTRSGSVVEEGPTPTGTDAWEANSDTSVGEVDLDIDTGGASKVNLIQYVTGDGPLDVAPSNGSSIEVTDYGIDAQQAGIAEVLKDGKTNAGDVEYRILDSNSNVLASKTESTSANYSVSAGALQADSDVTFNNSSGGQWSVAEVQVRVAGSNNIIQSEAISATIDDQGSITFTTLRVNLSLP